jgi:hypothetical protein
LRRQRNYTLPLQFYMERVFMAKEYLYKAYGSKLAALNKRRKKSVIP